MEADRFRAAASALGEFAAARVADGMRLGLGTGRTAGAFLDALEQRVRGGLSVTAVCTSSVTEVRARQMGIEILPSTVGGLDLDIDGADEVSPELDLVKGAGGALVREKIVAERSRRFWVVADSTKLVPRLGSRAPLPVEILVFDWPETQRWVEAACRAPARLRGLEHPVRSDNGNLLLDVDLNRSGRPVTELADELQRIPGVVGHGLFLGLATAILVSEGSEVRVLGNLDATRQLSGAG